VCFTRTWRREWVSQWLRDNAENLKKQDAQLKASNDVFERERQHLGAANEILAKSVSGLQQQVADINANIQTVKQQVGGRVYTTQIGHIQRGLQFFPDRATIPLGSNYLRRYR